MCKLLLDLKYRKENQNELLMSAIQSVNIRKVLLENNYCITSINNETLPTALAQNLLENLEFFLISDDMQEKAEKVVILLHSLDFQYKGYVY